MGQREVRTGATYVLTLLALLGLIAVGALLLLQVLMALVVPVAIVVVLVWVLVDRAAGFDALKSMMGFGVSATGRAIPGMPTRRGPHVLDVTRFRVTTDSGVPYDCEILGELRAPPPRLNDDVDVSGRRRRDGVVQVRRLYNRVAGTVVRGHVPLSVSGAQAAPWLLVALVIAAAALVLANGI